MGSSQIMLLIVSGFSFLGKSSIVYKNKLVLFLACTSIVSLMAVDYVNPAFPEIYNEDFVET